MEPQSQLIAEIIGALPEPPPRKLPTGEWACVSPFMFTYGLLVGVDPFGYRTRYCYERLSDALAALREWDGQGDPPGPWIKQKGRTRDGQVVDRCGPGAKEEQ